MRWASGHDFTVPLLLGLCAGVLLLVAPGLSASEAAPTGSLVPVESHIDWTGGRFELTLRSPLVPAGEMAPPKRRYLTEQQLTLSLEQAFIHEASKIPVDTSRTIGDLAVEDPSVLGRLSGLAEGLRFHSSRVDEDYATLEMRWSAGLWSGLIPLLEPVEFPDPLPEVSVWTPSREFSGLVVFAMGNLPWLGTKQLTARWQPALTFRLLSPDGEVVFDRSMANPEAVAEHGMAALSEGKFNEDRWRERIGFDPLRVVAAGVYGTNPRDLVLARDDWNRLLALPGNRDLLVNGNVLVLWGPFPDYTTPPNPDSVIDESLPAIQVIPQVPVPVDETAAPAAGGH